MKVSIIIACYNAEKIIESTIQSVLEQDYPNIEHIIVDGAVEDGVGEGGFADDVVPLRQQQLACDQDSGVVVPILDDFHEIASMSVPAIHGSL